MKMLKRTQQVFTAGTEAVYGDMWAKGEVDKIRTNLGYYEYIISFFVSTVFATAIVMILPFISLYTKGVHDAEYLLPSYAVVIIAAQAFYSFRTPYLTLVQGVGHYRQTRNGAIAEAIINLALSVILVQFIGIVGVAVGTLAANIFRTVQYALYIDNHLIPRGKMVFVKRILWAVANSLITVAIFLKPAAQFAYKGWLAWVVTAIVVTIASFAIAVLSSLIFYRKDMRAAIGIVKRSLLRKARRKPKSVEKKDEGTSC